MSECSVLDHVRDADDEELLDRLREIIALIDPVPFGVQAVGRDAWWGGVGMRRSDATDFR